MTSRRTARRVEDFLRVFFGSGNDADRYPEVTEGFKQSAVLGGITPVVLPRFVVSTQQATMYVIADDPVTAPHVPELINAFAGPTYCKTADVVPVALDPDDPVEAAILDHYGPSVDTYILSAGSNAQHRRKLRAALQRMQSTLAQRPIRLQRVDKSLGRLLGEFDAALAAGGEATSATILSAIVARGGLTASNLAHLRIKRLDRLGRGADLLGLTELPGVLLQDPPVRIREAVLNAVYQVVLAPALADEDVPAAVERLRDLEPALRLPVHDAMNWYDGPAATVLVVAAIGRADQAALTEALALRGSWSNRGASRRAVGSRGAGDRCRGRTARRRRRRDGDGARRTAIGRMGRLRHCCRRARRTGAGGDPGREVDRVAPARAGRRAGTRTAELADGLAVVRDLAGRRRVHRCAR